MVAPFQGAAADYCSSTFRNAFVTNKLILYAHLVSTLHRKECAPNWIADDFFELEELIKSFGTSGGEVFERYEPSERSTSKWHVFPNLLRISRPLEVYDIWNVVFSNKHIRFLKEDTREHQGIRRWQ